MTELTSAVRNFLAAITCIEPTARPALEVQEAHDRLLSLILGEAPSPFEHDDLYMIENSLSVLCWVLGHYHGSNGFTLNLARLENHWEREGVVFLDSGVLNRGPKDPGLTPAQEGLLERQRLDRIVCGIEHECIYCGCSDTKRCHPRCSWVTGDQNLCAWCAVKRRRGEVLQECRHDPVQ